MSLCDPMDFRTQAFPIVINSQSLLKLMSTASVIPSKHLILSRPFSSCLQSFPASESFPRSQFFASDSQSITTSVSASVLPVKIQGWFPLDLLVWSCSPRHSQESSPTPKFKSINSSVLQFGSDQSLNRVQLFATPWIAARQASLSITTSRVHSDSCPSSQWCHPAISSSVVPFSSCPQSLPASKSFPMSQLFAWGGQSTGASALASFPPKNIQDWSPLWWTGWISLQSKGLSRVFSNITVQKHQFFGTQLSSQSNSHTHIWPLEKP